jgi:hypothetical protein
MYENVGLDF